MESKASFFFRGSLSEEVFASGRYLWGIFEEISRLLKYRNNQFGEKTSLMIWATHFWREIKEPPQLIMFSGMFSENPHIILCKKNVSYGPV